MKNVKKFVLICAMCAVALDGWAQNYPSKVVRLMVAFSAGKHGIP